MKGTDPKKEGTFMEFAIEIKAKPGNFQELDQTLQALLPTKDAIFTLHVFGSM
jgi:hypothetical protein